MMLDVKWGNPSEFIDMSLLSSDWKTCSECVVFHEDGNPIAFLEMDIDNLGNASNPFICLFEVVDKGKGTGYMIIQQLKQEFQSMRLYPGSERARHFWEKCGFISEDEGDGTIIMEFSQP